MSCALTPEELASLTGYRSPAWQRRWLDRKRWVYETNRLNHPVVDRDYYRRKMGLEDAKPPRATPNWDAIDSR